MDVELIEVITMRRIEECGHPTAGNLFTLDPHAGQAPAGVPECRRVDPISTAAGN
jgi:hypothetical protein